MADIQISVSNTLDSPDAKATKLALREYADIIVNTPLFNNNNNMSELSDLMYTFLEDLYIKEPEEVINFANQKPSKKLINNLFSQFGISNKFSMAFPELLKTKTAYLLSQLFETKGSNETFKLFNNIIEEFYHNLNFYNVRIEQREFISIYETPTIENKFYLDPDFSINNKYDMTMNEATFLKDNDIEFQIYPKIYERHNKVDFLLKFFKPTESVVKLKLDFTDSVIVPKGTSEFLISTKKYDIYNKSIRNEDELVYKLEPVLINDPLSIITEIDSADLRTYKYLMQRQDFFDMDTRNKNPKNIFPIITNVLFIQFGTSDTMDTMEYLPELVRMFAMTKIQDDVFTFSIDGTTIKLPMQDYVNLLTYIKLKEIEFKTPGWSWGDHTVEPMDFTSFIYPKEKLAEIYELILYYKDMRHDHNTFLEFKRRMNNLTGSSNQQKKTKIFNIEQFHEFLAGNIPNTFPEFFIMLEEFYPLNVNIFAGKDQHKILIDEVNRLYASYNPATPRDLFNIIAIQDIEFVDLNNGLYDMLKIYFIDRYPRIIQKIDAIDNETDFLLLFLDNYKRMLVEVVKEDNFVTYFVNDTFKRFLLASTFKDEFFNPVMDLFQNYFFKAELSYQNSDAIIHRVKDKMQSVTCGVVGAYDVHLEGYYSTLNLLDNNVMKLDNIVSNENKLNDSWEIQIVNNETGVHTFTSDDDDVYNTQ